MARRFGVPDADEWLDSFDPQKYRELLASESLDPDPLERLNATMQLGFSVLATYLTSLVAGFGGEMTEIPPSLFDPCAKRGARQSPQSSDTVLCGPNQMARLLGGGLGLF